MEVLVAALLFLLAAPSFLSISLDPAINLQVGWDRDSSPTPDSRQLREQMEVKLVSAETDRVSEHLVIITSSEPEEILMSLRKHLEITQSISERVFLVRGDNSGLNVPKKEGLHIFSNPDIPEKILRLLDETESLFVSAWRTRLQQPPKKACRGGFQLGQPCLQTATLTGTCAN